MSHRSWVYLKCACGRANTSVRISLRGSFLQAFISSERGGGGILVLVDARGVPRSLGAWY